MSGARPLRAAVVGAGLMGRWHAHALVRCGGVVAAVVDEQPERARALAGRYPGARAVRVLEEVPPGVEVVHICTPPETHVALGEAAIARGWHALVEKPLAPTAAATAGLLRQARDRAVLLCPVHQLLFLPGVLRLERELRTVAPIRHLDFVACSAGAEGAQPETRDRVAFDILPHPLSLLARLLPVPLDAVEWQLMRPAAGELRATGRAGAISISMLVSMGGRPTVNQLRLIGEHGTLHVDLFHGFRTREAAEVSRLRKVLRPFSFSGKTFYDAMGNLSRRLVNAEPAYPGLRELIRRFYAAIRCAEPVPIPPEESLQVAAAQDVIRELA